MAERNSISRFRLPWRGPAQRVARREAAASPAEWRVMLRTRVLVCACIFGLWTAAIEARLVYLQVVDHASLMAYADSQHLRTIHPPAKRGEILDRNGHMLAYSVDADTIAADPSQVEQPDRAAALICRALDACDGAQQQVLADRLRRKGQFVYLARQISPDQAARIKALDFPWLLFYKESRRYLSEPGTRVARSRLRRPRQRRAGRARIDVRQPDPRPRGEDPRPGRRARHVMYSRVEQPADRRRRPRADDRRIPPVHRRARAAGRCRGERARPAARPSSCEPQTGEMLALANWPTFNPNAFGRLRGRGPPQPRASRTLRAGLDVQGRHGLGRDRGAGDRRPTIRSTAAPGIHHVRRRGVIRRHARYGVLPFNDVIVKSSNVGAIKVGLRLGAERLVRYVNRFGFGQTLSPDFRGESRGHRLESRATRRQCARVGVDGLPGRRHAAADGRRRSAPSPTAAS